jgi:hypothetical protein
MRSKYGRRFGQGVASIALTGLLSAGFVCPGGAATSSGIVTGSLRIFGGTAFAPRSGVPVAGRVVFKPSRGATHVLEVGKTGQFKINLEEGTYTSFGGAPAWGNECLVNGGKPFKIVAGHSLKVVVACVAL